MDADDATSDSGGDSGGGVEGNKGDRHVRALGFSSHVRQVQREADNLFILHWDGSVTLMSAKEVLDEQVRTRL